MGAKVRQTHSGSRTGSGKSLGIVTRDTILSALMGALTGTIVSPSLGHFVKPFIEPRTTLSYATPPANNQALSDAALSEKSLFKYKVRIENSSSEPARDIEFSVTAPDEIELSQPLIEVERGDRNLICPEESRGSGENSRVGRIKYLGPGEAILLLYTGTSWSRFLPVSNLKLTFVQKDYTPRRVSQLNLQQRGFYFAPQQENLVSGINFASLAGLDSWNSAKPLYGVYSLSLYGNFRPMPSARSSAVHFAFACRRGFASLVKRDAFRTAFWSRNTFGFATQSSNRLQMIPVLFEPWRRLREPIDSASSTGKSFEAAQAMARGFCEEGDGCAAPLNVRIISHYHGAIGVESSAELIADAPVNDPHSDAITVSLRKGNPLQLTITSTMIRMPKKTTLRPLPRGTNCRYLAAYYRF